MLSLLLKRNHEPGQVRQFGEKLNQQVVNEQYITNLKAASANPVVCKTLLNPPAFKIHALSFSGFNPFPADIPGN